MDEEARRAWQRALRSRDGPLLLRGLLQLTRPLDPLPVEADEAVRLYLTGRRAVLLDLVRAAGMRLSVGLEPREDPAGEA